MFELESVCKSYDGVAALAPLTLSFATAQTTVLLGPSGSGKSTVLRILIGLTRPDAGKVLFGGHLLTPENAPYYRPRMGYVIRNGGLFPHFTVRANVTLMARQLSWSPTRVANRLQDLSDLLRFPAAALDLYPAQLAAGQRQRAALIRAWMLDPDATLLDDPLGNLDAKDRAELQAEMRLAFRRLGQTIVVATDRPDEAAAVGDHVIVLERGRALLNGNVAEHMSRPGDPT
jgi:osmoprotectant transport system ATP-binding protein